MYTRAVEELPESLVKDGKSVFGTFRGHPKSFDIRGIYRPYGTLPLPTFITNLRIKSRLSYFFNVGDYIGSIEFFDAKAFGMAEVIFWDKKTRKKFEYHSLMGPRKRLIPHAMESAHTYSNKKGRYIRIGWNRKSDKLSVVFNLSGGKTGSDSTAALISHFNTDDMGEAVTISPCPTRRRSSAYYYLSASLHGAVTVFNQKTNQLKAMDDADGQAFLAINRTYMKFRSNGHSVTFLGEIDGKKISFRISSSSYEAVECEKYNSNVLFYNGELTPLPPVVITHPFGVGKKWVIQDTENMVDLTFTPDSECHKSISAVILTTEYRNFMGTFDGVIVTRDGQKINLKSMAGMAKTYLLRL